MENFVKNFSSPIVTLKCMYVPNSSTYMLVYIPMINKSIYVDYKYLYYHRVNVEPHTKEIISKLMENASHTIEVPLHMIHNTHEIATQVMKQIRHVDEPLMTHSYD